MINKVTLIGNLGQDPELKRLENGATVVKFSLATSDSYKDKNGEWVEQTEWHRIVIWSELGERAEKQLKKGDKIYLEGKLTYNKWVDKEGNKRETAQVKAMIFRSLTPKLKEADSFPPPMGEDVPF